MSVARVSLLLSVMTVALTTTAPARANEKEICAEQHVAGQRLRRAGSSRAAREQFVLCAREVCPGVLQRECSDWLKEVEASQPTIVAIVRGPSGEEVTNVKVFMDGELLADRLTGIAIPVDPGEHVFRFVSSEGAAVEERFFLNEGEKHRPLAVALSSGRSVVLQDRPADAAGARSGWPASVYVLGGVAVLGLGSFAAFGLVAKSRADDFESCRPGCDSSDVRAMRTQALIADVSLGVALVSLGAAVWILATH